MIYNVLLEKCLIPLSDKLLNTNYMSTICHWRKVSKMSEEQLKSLQSRNLSAILTHAVEHVPFYAGIKPDGVDLYAWLKQFPILTKHDINHQTNSLVSRRAKKKIKITTGGSSGFMGVFYTDKNAIDTCNAIQTVWWEWAGFQLGDQLIQTGVSVNRGVIKFLKDIILRVTYVSAFNLTDKQIFNLLKRVNGKSGICLGGYASSLRVFAEVALRHGMNVQFKTAISWGDKLFDSYKAKINRAFNCSVYETYGCSEGIMIGSKKDHDYFYLMSPHVVVEIVDERGNEVPDGQMGYVVLTCLSNFTMPLIRYKIGDLAIKLPQHEYPEKRELNFPLLKKIIGRNTDVIHSKSGNYIVVQVVESLFEGVDFIEKFKIIQHSIDELEIEYVVNRIADKNTLMEIEKMIRKSLVDPMQIKWSLVHDIAPSPSGKPQFIDSRIINI